MIIYSAFWKGWTVITLVIMQPLFQKLLAVDNNMQSGGCGPYKCHTGREKRTAKLDQNHTWSLWLCQKWNLFQSRLQFLNRGNHHLLCLHMSLVTAIATTLEQSTPIRFQDELRQTVCEILEPRCVWSRSLESVTKQENGNLPYLEGRVGRK